MSAALTKNVAPLIKQLIAQVTGLQDGTETFARAEKGVVARIKSADSLFFTNEKDIDRIIDSLTKKFEFHGFKAQGRELQQVYRKLVPRTLAKPERMGRMNVIKFLLDVSNSPTNNIYKYVREFEKRDEEDVIDWPKYLTEDIPRWSPPPDESSDEWSDASEGPACIDSQDSLDGGTMYKSKAVCGQGIRQDSLSTYRSTKARLLTSLQSGWFHGDHVRVKPPSTDSEANVAILWDDFLRMLTRGLTPIKSSDIITEYRVMREVIWQLHEPHSSCCFEFAGNSLVPKAGVAIASVRPQVLDMFLGEFVPYIEWLQILREFHESLGFAGESQVAGPPHTYRSYDLALQTVIGPIFEVLKVMEDKINDQETIDTLLTLSHKIRPLFQRVRILKEIHCNVILDFRTESPLRCTTTLLLRLHKSLLYASSKLEQDLYLTLYLHSLYKYFTIVNSWLAGKALHDDTGEFVLADENPKQLHELSNHTLFRAKPSLDEQMNENRKAEHGEQDWQMQFVVKPLDDACSDSLINVICTQVLQIGKNIHLLRLLGKLHLVPQLFGVDKETIYEAYIEKILDNIASFFNASQNTDQEVAGNNLEAPPLSPTFVFPATCPDECRYLTEMDRLENLVDTSNTFLMKAFESYFIKKADAKEVAAERSLFDRISGLSKGLFPVQQMMEHVFVELLEERFSTSGLMVKNVLIGEYHLETQFAFLKNVFLFGDDLIFPLYRHIFQQMDSEGIWGNHTWLTSHLQDIIMDAYPNFYEQCTVEVKNNWQLCSDPLQACTMLNISYRIRWPVNIIIRDEHMAMYRDLFQFILRIKWALYTLNHLYFTDLEPKGKSVKSQHRSLRRLISKLKILRFGLINVFSNIQHYILGHVFSKHSCGFERAFEQAYDLESLLRAHAEFIQPLHKVCCGFQEYNASSHGFYMLLYLVRKLRIMWRNFREVNDDELEKCEALYLMCHKKVNPIINPNGYDAYFSRD